ncbi:hypothetical protein GCM10010399_32440 [Dactylosporangium fulvum]
MGADAQQGLDRGVVRGRDLPLGPVAVLVFGDPAAVQHAAQVVPVDPDEVGLLLGPRGLAGAGESPGDGEARQRLPP